jgi:Predicted GTPase
MQIKVKMIGSRNKDINAIVGHLPETAPGTTQVFVKEDNTIKVLIDLSDSRTKRDFWQRKLVQNEQGMFLLIDAPEPTTVFCKEMVMATTGTEFQVIVTVTDRDGNSMGIFKGAVSNSPENARTSFWSLWNTKGYNPFIPEGKNSVHLKSMVAGYSRKEVTTL